MTFHVNVAKRDRKYGAAFSISKMILPQVQLSQISHSNIRTKSKTRKCLHIDISFHLTLTMFS